MTTPRRLTSSELSSHLSHHIGTESYHSHPMFGGVVYTDGVAALAEHGGEHGAAWLLDLLLPKCAELLGDDEQHFLSIKIVSKNSRCMIFITDGNEDDLFSQMIGYTDLQEGTYRMYCVASGESGVLMLTSEY